MWYLFETPCWRCDHVVVKLQCSNNCASFFDVSTVEWGWNCHFLVYSLACCVNIKLICTLLCFVSSVLRCKHVRKVQDALAQILKIFKKFVSLLKLIGVRKVTWTKFCTHWRSQRLKKMQHPHVSKDCTPLIVVMYVTGVKQCWWKERALVSGSTWRCGMKDHRLWSWCNSIWRDARGILHRQGRTTGEPSSLCKSMELCSNNSRGMVHSGWEKATGWDVWCSADRGESRTVYKYELGICVCVYNMKL